MYPMQALLPSKKAAQVEGHVIQPPLVDVVQRRRTGLRPRPPKRVAPSDDEDGEAPTGGWVGTSEHLTSGLYLARLKHIMCITIINRRV